MNQLKNWLKNYMDSRHADCTTRSGKNKKQTVTSISRVQPNSVCQITNFQHLLYQPGITVKMLFSSPTALCRHIKTTSTYRLKLLKKDKNFFKKYKWKAIASDRPSSRIFNKEMQKLAFQRDEISSSVATTYRCRGYLVR